MLHLKHSSSITQNYYYLPKSEQRLRVPKNGVWRSKRLLKPRPTPRQHWGLELRTSLIGVKYSEISWTFTKHSLVELS